MSKSPLLKVINKIHIDCHKLCKIAFGVYFPVSGNIGVFCQNEKEYKKFTKTKEKLTESSSNPNQKYFKLKVPIVVSSKSGIPEAIYTSLYIRKPDPTPYGKYLGDVDFVLSVDEYSKIKEKVTNGEFGEGVKLYDRPGWDTIQITDSKINTVGYVGTMEMALKARVKFD